MSLLRIRYQTVEFGDVDIHLRTLRDTQEYLDEGGIAESLGLSSANWSLFGVVWDSGHALARLMFDYDIKGKRILEVGCGIGLASLVLNHRSADITATDYHPEAEKFLQANVALNGGNSIPFVRTDWDDDDCGIGKFNVIIGSDLLYDANHIEPLSNFIDRHAQPKCEVIIVDPGREPRRKFGKKMVSLGYTQSRRKAENPIELVNSFHGDILSYVR